MYIIYDITPSPDGDDCRIVELFETKEHAEYALKALEEVNVNFNLYRIERGE